MQAAFQTHQTRDPSPDTNLPEPHDFMPRLIRAHNNVLNMFEKICGIHLARWRLLLNLARQGAASQNELSRSTTIAPAAVTRIFADMERSNLIMRRPSQQDKRQMIVSLTEAGTQLVHATAKRRQIFLDRALTGFTKTEVTQLESLLARLEANLTN